MEYFYLFLVMEKIWLLFHIILPKKIKTTKQHNTERSSYKRDRMCKKNKKSYLNKVGNIARKAE